MDLIESHHTALIIYDDNENLDKVINNLKNKSNISTKHPEEVLNLQPVSTYDIILSGVIAPYTIQHDGKLLSTLLKIAKPDARIVIYQAVKQLEEGSNQLTSQLKLSGFTKITESKNVSLNADDRKVILEKLNVTNDVEVIEVMCYKPSFEVGSSTCLTLKPKSDTGLNAVWKLEDTMDDDVETIDPDNLLDDEDIKKPNAPLRVCNTTGKRKACKDCSCGLAKELETENDTDAHLGQNPEFPRSACGSCYLGDAFRCATCPYLGTPAFKPGEKIQLSKDQLQPDL